MCICQCLCLCLCLFINLSVYGQCYLDCIQGSSDVLVTRRPSFSDERKTQHFPLSAAVSLPPSMTSSTPTRHQWRRSSVDPAATTPPPPSRGRRQEDDRGGATTTSPRYKTELCRTYAEHGACRYGDRCQFAHGRDDLRAVARHPKYKTDLCRTYHTTGLCPYGPRCHFIHNDDEARRQPTAPLPRTAEQRDVDLAARELELRLALLSLYQRRKLDSYSPSLAATSSCFHLDPNSYQSAAATVAPPAVPQRHVRLDRRQSVPSTAVQSSARPSALIGALSPPIAGAVDSVGNSASSSAADDDSPPPLSPTFGVADDACRQLMDITTSNDRLTALLILAARLRLLQGTTHTH